MRRNTSHHGADSFYPLGSMPRCCNSLRRTRLIQVAKDVSPSALAASSSCALKSSGNRIWYGGERFSNGVDMVITLHYYTYMVITIVLAITQKSTPRSAGNTYGASNQQRKLGAVMVAVNHIPHLVHTQTAFVWRFGPEYRRKNQLIASVENSYDSRAPHKTGAGIGVLGKTEAHNTRPRFFLCRIVTPYQWWAVRGRSNPRRFLQCPVTPTLYSPPPAKLAFPVAVILTTLRRLPTWLLSLPLYILKPPFSGALSSLARQNIKSST
ncbi:hypothetical protein ECDEC8C_3563 [Escherichia coli DEC8C]|nr:hypothetical protein ECDEC8C_3563 [Escherichia coli DEC8C]